MNYLKDNLKYLRKIFDLRQDDIAAQVDKQRTTIANWESGLSVPSLEEVIVLSKYFDVRLDIFVLGNMEKAGLITDEHVLEFAKKGKLKKNPVEYDTTDLPEPVVNEGEASVLWQVLDELKSLKNNVSKLRIEVRKLQ